MLGALLMYHFLAMASLTCASVDRKEAFTLEMKAVCRNASLSPAQLMLKTHARHGKTDTAPELIKRAAEADSLSFPVPARSRGCDMTYVTMGVGVGNENFNLNFDTGSSDFFVFSTLQPLHQQVGRPHLYRPRPDKRLRGFDWEARYKNGAKAKGLVYRDKVVVGPVTVTSHAVQAATSVSSSFIKPGILGMDGILGMALEPNNHVSPSPQGSFFDRIHRDLAKPLFAVALGESAGSYFNFGFIDHSQYRPPITYVNVDRWPLTTFWGISITGFAVGQDDMDDWIEDVIFDTGTTLIYMTEYVVRRYYRNVRSARFEHSRGGWTYDCGKTLPDFAIRIGSVIFIVPGHDMMWNSRRRPKTDRCFGGMQMSQDLEHSVLGLIFIKLHYIIHDLSPLYRKHPKRPRPPRIGIARRRISQGVL